MSVNHIAWRNKYVRILLRNRMKPESERLREFYTDDAYIHHHHPLQNNDLYLLECYLELQPVE